MLTRTRMHFTRGLAVAFVSGLTSVSAAAMDEVVEHGTDAARSEVEEVIVYGTSGTQPEAVHVEMRAELAEYVESLNRRLKEQLDEQLRQQSAADVKLALVETSSRG